jgi:carbonic anhydrase
MASRPLPEYLARRYQGWRATTYAENRSWYRRLAEDGQHPRAMVVSCCDSRVHVTSIFGADSGEFFIHRNIANLLEATSFVGRWMDILRPAWAELPAGEEAERLRAFEKLAVRASLANLLTFPFVRSEVEEERLTLHGLWNDIGEGTLEAWDEGRGTFVPL